MKLERIIEYMGNGNISKARAAVLSQLDADRFNNNMEIASRMELLTREASALFEVDDQELLILSAEQWDRSYWIGVCVELSNNFSIEKLKHVVEVMKYLRQQGDPKFCPEKPAVAESPASASRPKTTIYVEERSVGQSMAIGGGIGAVAGVVVGFSLRGIIVSGVLCTAAIGGVVGAGLMYVAHKNRKK